MGDGPAAISGDSIDGIFINFYKSVYVITVGLRGGIGERSHNGQFDSSEIRLLALRLLELY